MQASLMGTVLLVMVAVLAVALLIIFRGKTGVLGGKKKKKRDDEFDDDQNDTPRWLRDDWY